jgi:hypothetical protein
LLPVGPLDLLERLAAVAVDPNRPSEWSDPLVQIHTRSGAVMRGHVVAAGSWQGEGQRHFLLKLEPKSDAHLARDLAYVNGSDIETVLLFDVDLFIDSLPAR